VATLLERTQNPGTRLAPPLGSTPSAAPTKAKPARRSLRYAEPDEQITLISYTPFDYPSVWTEVGPAHIHAAWCDGNTSTGAVGH
jgi:hypothetical protein